MLPGPAIQNAIDEEGRGPLYPTTFAPCHILLDAGERALLPHIPSVPLLIQTHRLRKVLEIGIRKGVLVVEEVVVHLPEFALYCSPLGCQSGM